MAAYLLSLCILVQVLVPGLSVSSAFKKEWESLREVDHEMDYFLENEVVNAIRTGKLMQDPEHIAQHMEWVDIDAESLSPTELDFNFFTTHDNDNNNMLDGLELRSAIAHPIDHSWDHIKENMSDEEGQDEETLLKWGKKLLRLKYVYPTLYLSVDKILEEDDKDRDGYISYPEFKRSRRAAATLENIGYKSEF